MAGSFTATVGMTADFERDPLSKALINRNVSELKRYKAEKMRERRLREMEQMIHTLCRDVARLQSRLEEMTADG